MTNFERWQEKRKKIRTQAGLDSVIDEHMTKHCENKTDYRGSCPALEFYKRKNLLKTRLTIKDFIFDIKEHHDCEGSCPAYKFCIETNKQKYRHCEEILKEWAAIEVEATNE
jgi:hypothetical protein